MTEPTNYDRFMAAFNEVEDHIKRVLGGGTDKYEHAAFMTVLDDFRDRYPRRLPETHYKQLAELAKVRNALTHRQYVDNRRLADPSEAGIVAMERARDRLLYPASALDVLGHGAPLTVGPDVTVGEALHLMHENDFSQLPVYDESGYVDLLTTNAAARWVAAQWEKNDGLAEDAPVSELLNFTEATERVKHVRRSTSAIEAVRHFVDGAEKGEVLTALIVTETGKRRESPLAMIVAADLPALSGA